MSGTARTISVSHVTYSKNELGKKGEYSKNEFNKTYQYNKSKLSKTCQYSMECHDSKNEFREEKLPSKGFGNVSSINRRRCNACRYRVLRF